MKTSRTLKIGLLLSAIISMIIGFSMMNNLITANAQVSSAGGKSFYVEGAAVRLSDDFADNGVSFHIIIDKTFTPESYNVYKKYFDDDGLLKEGVTTGTIVAPAKYVITESFTKDTVLVAPDSTVIADIDTTAAWVDYTVGSKEYKKSIAYIYNIPEAYYTVDLVVAGYITDGTDTVYTKKSEPFSLCWVAVEEYEDSNSRLTPEQKEDLREDYIENYGEEYTVSYYDGDTLLGQEDCLYGKGLSADTPKIEGKYFVGYTNRTETGVWGRGKSLITGNTRLYAKWADYNFSSLDDLDINATERLNVSPIEYGIVADDEAVDGYALKATTTANGTGSGIIVNFNNIDISKYSQIIVRVKGVGGYNYGIYVNDISSSVLWKQFSTYTTVDILPTLKAEGQEYLTKLKLSCNVIAGEEIYLDYVSFIEGEITYDFSSPDDVNELALATAVNGAYGLGITQYGDAEDGYALKAGCYAASGSGIQINLGTVDLSIYGSILVRLHVNYAYYVAVNGIDITERANHTADNAFETLDLVKLINNYNADKSDSAKIRVVNTFTIHRNYNQTVIRIDSIRIEPMKTEYTFSSDADLSIATAVNGAYGLGTAQYDDAEDGYALKAGCSAASGSGIQINLGTVDLSVYGSILVRLHVNYAYYVAVNGIDITERANHTADNAFETLDLVGLINNYNAGQAENAKIRVVNTFTIHRNYNKTLIRIDSIRLERKKLTYNFSSSDELRIATAVNGAYGLGIAQYDDAEDGYALKAGCSSTSGSGIKVNLNHVSLDRFESVLVRVKVQYQYYIAVNGIDITPMGQHTASNVYGTVDLIELVNSYNEDKSESEKIKIIDNFTIHRNHQSVMIYIDSVRIILKTNA